MRIEHLGALATGTSGSRIRSILAYLILQSGQRIPRGVLATLCWPESSESQARTNLRRELHIFLKQNPGLNNWIETTRQAVAWTSPDSTFIDVLQFESAARQMLDDAVNVSGATLPSFDAVTMEKQLEDILGLYTSDFLTDSYDSWIIEKRDSLSELRLDLLLVASGHLAELGNSALALKF